MSGTDQRTSTGKSGQRNKGKQRTRKSGSPETSAPVHMQSVDPEHQSHPDPIQVQDVTADREPALASQIEPIAALPDVTPTAVAELAPVSLLVIANAYRDYTRKSFQQIGSYFEQIAGVRSLDNAMKVQAEFVKRACETSLSETQRIYELHNRLASQTLLRFRGWDRKAAEPHGGS